MVRSLLLLLHRRGPPQLSSLTRYAPISTICTFVHTRFSQPPRPAYVAPEERSAAAHSDKAKQDPIETWSVTQLDKKGKKKKGTLGVGNGNLFFASESDKACYLLIVYPSIRH
jgi:hypothetical protein